MSLPITDIRIGEPTRCGGISVFPLFTGLPLFPDGNGHLDYLLGHEAMAAATITVTEVSEEGEVGRLVVENAGDQPALFLEGMELTGAKQNRVLRESVLVAPTSRTRIPVCCVQRGKWTYSSRQFSSGSCCPPTLRYMLKQGTCGNAASRRLGSQASLWREIRRKHEATNTRAEKDNLSDALDVHRGVVEDLRRSLPCPEGASGIAVALGGKVVCLDLFDKPATLTKVWDRLVQGLTLDALEFRSAGCRASDADISVRLYMARDMRWQRGVMVGLGETFRATGEDGTLATALVVDSTLLHLSMSMPV